MVNTKSLPDAASGEEPRRRILVERGTYEALLLNAGAVVFNGESKIRFVMKLLSNVSRNESTIEHFLPVKRFVSTNPELRFETGGDRTKVERMLAALGQDMRDRLPRFDRPLRVRVETVTRDSDNDPLPSESHYSVVRKVLGWSEGRAARSKTDSVRTDLVLRDSDLTAPDLTLPDPSLPYLSFPTPTHTGLGPKSLIDRPRDHEKAQEPQESHAAWWEAYKGRASLKPLSEEEGALGHHSYHHSHQYQEPGTPVDEQQTRAEWLKEYEGTRDG